MTIIQRLHWTAISGELIFFCVRQAVHQPMCSLRQAPAVTNYTMTGRKKPYTEQSIVTASSKPHDIRLKPTSGIEKYKQDKAGPVLF